MGCKACALPATIAGSTHALLWPPQGHTTRKLLDALAAVPTCTVLERSDTLVVFSVGNSRDFVGTLARSCTKGEAKDTRILLTDTPTPSFEAFGRVGTVSDLSMRLRGDWVIELLVEKRLFSVVQPIVDAARPDSIFAHEYLIRGIDRGGDIIHPAALFEAAADPRVFFNLDRDARLTAVNTAVTCNVPGNIFVNFMPGSVYDPTVCLRTTAVAVDRLGINPDRIVFEVVESDRIDDLDHLAGIVKFYRDAGYRIALDDFGTGQNNIGTYLALQPDYVKLDKSLVHGAQSTEATAELVGVTIAAFRSNGIEVIAEGIEDATMARRMHALGATYLQGYHFGRPARPEKRSVQEQVA